eukprot:gene9570-10577_t
MDFSYAVLLLVFFLFVKDVDSELPIWRSGAMDSAQWISTNATIKPCKIVIKDNIRGFLNWQQEWFIKATSSKGVFLLAANHKDQQNADVWLYHAPTHQVRLSPLTSSTIPTNKPVRVMVSMEQPRYAPVFADLAYLKSTMHLLVTYSLSPIYPDTKLPNLPITYYPSHILSPNAVLRPPDMVSKTGYDTGVLVATFTSNCGNAGAKDRLKYLEELMKHIEVHSYGRCLHNRDEPEMKEDPNWPSIAQRRARKIEVLTHYHFYLAFENLAVDDYVSEKVFEGLVAGTIPVYRGSPSINKFMPSDESFINANSLTPLQLATLLKEIAGNQDRYMQYMEFKKHSLPQSFLSITNMSYVHPNVAIRICEKVNKLRNDI